MACCFSYVLHRIPRRVITSAYWTSSSCSKPAVILVTRNGREMCADPEAHWVQEYLEHLQLLED
ncbi:CCL3 protein, partial [Sylvietta virens]|nr:CCL3 protein [Sylvietta virens]